MREGGIWSERKMKEGEREMSVKRVAAPHWPARIPLCEGSRKSPGKLGLAASACFPSCQGYF